MFCSSIDVVYVLNAIPFIPACGKTTFVKDLLLDHTTRITPGIQRIIWLYKRWQPLYSFIQRTVLPRVEFVQGIPNDLEDDDYFDPRITNLLILDDLFSESGKDKRITDLFTEGSHHRSLSVISINQNLFGNKDPTQRRNCHYLVLFNNPVDRQSLMTLARQMYPGNSEKFIKIFGKATKDPYGFLLVDLKPFTPENDRLKAVVTWADQIRRQEVDLENQLDHVIPPIKGENQPEIHHSSTEIRPVHIEKENSDQEDIMADKGQACDDCGLLFDSTHDVQRHIKRGWCPENNDNLPSKKRKIDEESSEHVEDEAVEENQGFISLWQNAVESNDDRYEKMYDKFIQDGEDKESAQDLAEDRIQPYNERAFFNKYDSLLDSFIIPLQNSELHHKILQDIQSQMQKDVSTTSAIKSVLRKYKPDFKELFEIEFSDEESDDESDEEEDRE